MAFRAVLVVCAGALALASCKPALVQTPTRDDQTVERELLATEDAVFAAIQRRDQDALGALLADEFVLRMPGQPDVDRAGFLAAIAAIPGEIESVTGVGVAARRTGAEAGAVTGEQVATVRVDGQVLVDRGAFADVFVRRDDRWQMVLAFTVPLSTTPSTSR